MGVWRDCSWRTGLGTCFYNRVGEARLLGELVGAGGVVVVYGPRGVGKSELARYTLSRLEAAVVHIDARRRGSPIASVLGGGDALRELAERLAEVVLGGGARGLAALLEQLYLEASRVIRGRLVVLVDEPHLLLGGRDAALVELETAAGLVAKGVVDATLVVTISEGLLVAADAVERLQGYVSALFLLEHLGEGDFRGLFEEYTASRGCRLSLSAVLRLAGGAPGALPVLCRGAAQAKWWLSSLLLGVERAVGEARRLPGAPGDAISVVAEACRLLGGRVVSPAEDPWLDELGRLLVVHNAAYPVYPGVVSPSSSASRGVVYRPAYPVVRDALCLAAEEGLGSVMAVLDAILEHLGL